MLIKLTIIKQAVTYLGLFASRASNHNGRP